MHTEKHLVFKFVVAVIASHLELNAHHATLVSFREFVPFSDFAAVSHQIVDRFVKLLVSCIGLVVHFLN